MIQNLSIRNYKSLKNVNLACKKVNVLIGEPNSGKSNIIEALSLKSPQIATYRILNDVIRYKNLGDLFSDFNINDPIVIETDEAQLALSYMPENGDFQLNGVNTDGSIISPEGTRYKHSGERTHGASFPETSVRFYEYKRLTSFEQNYIPYLAVPYGGNIPALLLSNKEFRSWVSDFFQSKGFKLTLKPAENEINMSKIIGDEIFSYPYHTISETLQRIVFFVLAVKSNKDAVLLFDEPESNTFPYYTGFMGERIALDETNQFFITTHNPYLLLKLIEKSKTADINVCVTTMKDYETRVTVLNSDQIGEVLSLDADAFLNLDRIIEM